MPNSTRHVVFGSSLAVAVILLPRIASSATPEQTCLYQRSKAAGAYASCIQTAVGKVYLGNGAFALPKACIVKYSASWAKLQLKAAGTGTVCDGPRFVDNGNGTVTDNLSGLQWEQKAEDASVHDVNAVYSWSTSDDGDATDADGTVFTTFLTGLNGVGFAGQYDWRLPTLAELLSIVDVKVVQPGLAACLTPPCIDPMFGPTAVDNYYWSGTTFQATTSSPPRVASWVVFPHGGVSLLGNVQSLHTRAVRGGL